MGEIGLRQLVDNLVLECSRTHGRLQYLQVKQFCRLAFIGCNIIDYGFQRVFYRTSRQYLGSIVAGRFLPVATIQAVYESALWQNNGLSCLLVAQHLGDIKNAHTAIRDKEGTVLRLVGLVHFYIVLFCIETSICKQAFIYTAQLVHSQIGIADSAAVVLLFRERQCLDDLLPLDISDSYIGQMFQILVIEQRRVDRTHPETLVVSRLGCIVSVRQQVEEMLYAVVEEIAVAAFLGIKAYHLQVTQRLKGIASFIYLVAYRKYLQFLAAFGIEEEKQTVYDGQAVVLYFRLKGVVCIVANWNVVVLLPPIECLIRQCLNSKDDSLFKVFGDFVCILVTFFNNGVHQHHFAFCSQRLFAHQHMEQGIVILECRHSCLCKEFVERELQITTLSPFILVEEKYNIACQH